VHRPGDTATHLLHALRDGDQTAQALGGRLGLDVSSVRRHLDSLVERGWVAYGDRAGGPGRPRRHYRLTEAGWESFPRDYSLLLGSLLRRLQGRVGRETVLACFDDVAGELAATIPPGGTTDERMRALLRLYGELGFEASLESDGPDAAPALVQRNCPFLATAKCDPEALCDCLDEALIRRVLPGADVRLEQCMATGDNLCRHAIRLPA